MAGLTAAAIYTMQGANTLSGFMGNRQQAKAAMDQANYTNRVYGIDATLADQQATDAIARGHEAEMRQLGATRSLVGSQRAAFAAQGIDANSGSAAKVQADTTALGELDALTIRNNAAREAYGYQMEAADYRTRGALALAAGKTQAQAYNNQSYATLLSGAMDMYGQYSRTHPPTSGGK